MTRASDSSSPIPLPLAERCALVQPSATAELFAKVVQLREQGEQVIGLHVGEPDFDTPAHILGAARDALARGATRYTPVRGIAPLREAIAEDSARRRAGVRHSPDEIVVSVGAKQSLFNLALALFGPGDEVIVPGPCWVSYPDQLRLAGAQPVVVDTARSDFKLTPEELRAACTERTRGLILCTPNNPTGAGYSAQELRALADVVAERSMWVLVDEIYSELVYDDFVQTSWLEVAPEQRDRTVIVDGVSKRFAMTGFRIGWSLAPARVARACETLQSQSTTSAAAVAQHAALAALTGPDDEVLRMRHTFARRRQRVLAAVDALDGVVCRAPEGAFYAFLDVRERLKRPVCRSFLGDDLALARTLLDRQRVALVPGTAFLAPGFLRLSYAASDDDLQRALERLTALLTDP